MGILGKLPNIGDIVGDVLGEVGKTARQVLPDKRADRAQDLEEREFDDRDAEREYELGKGQIEINKIEAAHESIFVAGWRPALGWVSALGSLMAFVVLPLFTIIQAMWKGAAVPTYPIENLAALIAYLLGSQITSSVRKIREMKADPLAAGGLTLKTSAATSTGEPAPWTK